MGEAWVKKSKNNRFFLLFLTVALIASFSFSAKTQAAELNFRQSILPVRFVYVSRDGGIEKVWGNVKANDTEYVVRFYSAQDEKEIAPTQDKLASYQEVVRDFTRWADQNVFEKKSAGYNNRLGCSSKENLDINFIQQGATMEEVRTYV